METSLVSNGKHIIGFQWKTYHWFPMENISLISYGKHIISFKRKSFLIVRFA